MLSDYFFFHKKMLVYLNLSLSMEQNILNETLVEKIFSGPTVNLWSKPEKKGRCTQFYLSLMDKKSYSRGNFKSLRQWTLVLNKTEQINTDGSQPCTLAVMQMNHILGCFSKDIASRSRKLIILLYFALKRLLMPKGDIEKSWSRSCLKGARGNKPKCQQRNFQWEILKKSFPWEWLSTGIGAQTACSISSRRDVQSLTS